MPPLGVWVATAALIVVLLAGMVPLAFRARSQAIQRFDNQSETLLRTEWQHRTDPVRRVVVLGTSLTQAGVALPPFFAEKTGGRYRVARLFRLGANLESFTDGSTVFRLLERYPPDVLLVEENLLFFPLDDQWALDANATGFRQVVQWLLRDAHLTEPTGVPFDALPAGYDTVYQTSGIRLRSFIEEIRQRRVRPFDSTSALHRTFAALRRRGTRLVLLHFPRPAAVEALIYSPARKPALDAVAAAYERAYQMPHWHLDQPWPNQYFGDEAHLNRAGAARYSAWLADRLMALD
jgi:hypothetical protein